MRSPSRGRFSSWMGTEDFDRAISTITPFIFILFIAKIVTHHTVLFVADTILMIAFLKLEGKLSSVMHKMLTSSSYYFVTPYFLVPLGFVALVLCAIGFVLCSLDLVKSQEFILTFLYTTLQSLSIFLLSTATKCILVGAKIVSLKFIRRGFFGVFQRIFIILRSLFVTVRWICYFCNKWPIPSIATIITQPKTTSCLIYIVMKCVLLLWLLWDIAFTINAYRVNSEVALKPAPPELVIEKCVVCMDIPTEPIILVCDHILCYECAFRWLSTNPTCPVCRHPIAEKKNIEFFDGAMPISTFFSVF
jgi:hypothetical protein